MDDNVRRQLNGYKEKGCTFDSFGDYIIVFMVPDDAVSNPIVEVKDAEFATYMANRLKVISIINKHFGSSYHNKVVNTKVKPPVTYTVNETIGSDSDQIYHYKSFERVFYFNVMKNHSDKWCSWHHNGTMAELYEYKESKMDARWTKWFDNRHFRSIGTIKDGSHDGVMIWFHENGTKRMLCMYENKRINGIVTYWYENGNKKEEGMYKDNARIGKWIEWDETGNIISNKNYDQIGY